MKMLYTKSKKGGKISPCHTYLPDDKPLTNNFNKAFEDAKLMFLDISNNFYNKKPLECIKFEDDALKIEVNKFLIDLDLKKGSETAAPNQTAESPPSPALGGGSLTGLKVKKGGRVLNFSDKKEITPEEKNILQEAICKLCLLGFKIINKDEEKECSNVIKKDDFYKFLTDNIESHTTFRNEGYIMDYISIVNKTKNLLRDSRILIGIGNTCSQINTQQVQSPYECKPCLCPKYMEKFQNLDEVEAKISAVLKGNSSVIPKVIDNSCEDNSNKRILKEGDNYITLKFKDDDGIIKPVCITFINKEVAAGGVSKKQYQLGKKGPGASIKKSKLKKA